jgi:hypothetical protein
VGLDHSPLVKEVGSDASQRQLREKLLDAARREIDGCYAPMVEM